MAARSKLTDVAGVIVWARLRGGSHAECARAAGISLSSLKNYLKAVSPEALEFQRAFEAASVKYRDNTYRRMMSNLHDTYR